jgi:hypothetical protein
MLLDEIKLDKILTIWLQVSVLLTFLEAYLKVNKIWIRKHEVVVSESVSVFAQLLALTAGIPFTILYVLDGSYEGAVANGMKLVVYCVFITIGIGLWVERERGISFWQKFVKSLRLESGEASTLLRDFFRPAGAAQVIRILHGLCLIDEHMDDKERAFVQTFAEDWGIDLEKELAEYPYNINHGKDAYENLRKDVREYIEMSPPKDQARQLRDVMFSLVNIDGNVSLEEEIIMAELGAMLENFSGDEEREMFGVYIAPQNSVQENALLELLPNLIKKTRLGGEVFQVGEYFSPSYSNMICRLYREAGYLTVVEKGAKQLR